MNRYYSCLECFRFCGCFSNIDYGNFCFNIFYIICWVFNKYIGVCDCIRFGGCGGGNDNNFWFYFECEFICGFSYDWFFGFIFGIGNMVLGVVVLVWGNIV